MRARACARAAAFGWKTSKRRAARFKFRIGHPNQRGHQPLHAHEIITVHQMPRTPKRRKSKRKYRLNTMFQRIGEMTGTWAYLDLAIDHCIISIHHDWGGSAVEPEIPRTAYSRKVGYLRAWFNSNPELAVVFKDFDDVILRLEEAAEHRHRLTHGIAIDLHLFRKTGVTTTMRSLRRLDQKTYLQKASYTLTDLRNFRSHVLGLAVFMGAFSEILRGDPVSQDKPDKSLGSLLIQIDGIFPRTKRRRRSLNKRR
jgi:hypothetical protein